MLVGLHISAVDWLRDQRSYRRFIAIDKNADVRGALGNKVFVTVT